MAETNARTIVLASRNAKKRDEIADLLAPCGIRLTSVARFHDAPEIVEDGDTFAENSAKKAVQTAQHLSRWVIGEDSGLSVDALNGAPGVYSARYSGSNATDDTNNRKLMNELQGVPDERRGAGYTCSVTVSDPTGNVRIQIEGTCRGRITTEPLGTNGFGYDPYFLIPEYHRTFGQLSSIVKQQLSHRARAFQRIIPALVNLYRSEIAAG